MKKAGVVLAVIMTLLLMQAQAYAWNATGHMVVACIAWKKLTPETRRAALLLLKKHPDYSRWVQGLPDDDEIRGQRAFMEASIWPDVIKRDERFYDDERDPGNPQHLPAPPGCPDAGMHKSWHYIDIPYATDGTPTVAPRDPTVVSQIDVSRSGLRGDTGGYYLSWLIHLVGDLHQPLHCIQRFTRAEPHGDRGGNGVIITTPDGREMNLHAYWDDLLGDDTSDKNIALIADRIMLELPDAKRPATSPADWQKESTEIAENFVYSIQDHGPAGAIPAAGKDYQTQAETIARRRIALAGYRLADLLNHADLN